MKYKIVSVDFQKDFTDKGGLCYKPRSAVSFVKYTLIPFLKKKNIRVAEIISDYRQPRLGDRGDCCHPGEWGYESEIPEVVKEKKVWIKCMNSPIWIRDNIGNPNKKPGLPYQDAKKFDKWVKNIGKPGETTIVLIGLTLDCCVLCAAQEFNFRGFDVKILKEAVDVYSGNIKDKGKLLISPIKNWSGMICWSDFKKIFN